MSVLIKGMKMPKDGERLKVRIYADGQVIVDKGTYYEEYEAVELPDHGRLVDADDVIAESRSGDYWWETEQQVPGILNEIPTIIPAERSEE